MSDSVVTTELNSNESTSTKSRKIFKGIIFGILFVTLVLFFTILKLPQARLTGLMQGYVQVALDPYGIFLTDQGRELSVLTGLRYSLIKPAIEFPDQTRIELDDFTVSPSIMALLTGKMGGHASIHQGQAEMIIDGAGRSDQIDLSVSLNQVDLGKMGVFAFAAGLKGSGIISGNIHIDGTLSVPSSLSGIIDIKVKKLHLDEQNLMGFQLPVINVADGIINIDIKGGKLVMKAVQIGKPGDDLALAVTGDITLNRNLNASVLNLRAVMGFSDKVKQSISLIDSLLSAAKMVDGRYAYNLTGTLAAPFPIPEPTK